MLYLQTTKKALHALGLGREKLAPAVETNSPLGNWVVNVVPIARREAFLFMSTRSLLSFPILIGQRVPEPADMPAFLEHGARTLTDAMKVTESQSATLLRTFENVAICAAPSKSILGSMSAIASDYFRRAHLAGGMSKADLGAIIFDVNSTPRATLDWQTSFEVSTQLLAAAGEA